MQPTFALNKQIPTKQRITQSLKKESTNDKSRQNGYFQNEFDKEDKFKCDERKIVKDVRTRVSQKKVSQTYH